MADITGDLARDGFLWDKAYDNLNEEKHDRIAKYEDLLSRVLIRGKLLVQPGWLFQILT